MVKQDVDKEFVEGQRETRYLRMEYDAERERADERREALMNNENDLSVAKRQLGDLEAEEADQLKELRCMPFKTT